MGSEMQSYKNSGRDIESGRKIRKQNRKEKSGSIRRVSRGHGQSKTQNGRKIESGKDRTTSRWRCGIEIVKKETKGKRAFGSLIYRMKIR